MTPLSNVVSKAHVESPLLPDGESDLHENFTALTSAVSTFESITSEADAIAGLVNTCCESFRWVFGVFWRFDAPTKQFSIAVESGFVNIRFRDFVRAGLPFAIDHFTPGKRDDAPLFKSDFSDTPAEAQDEFIKKHHVRAVVSIPYYVQSSLRGIFEFFTLEDEPYSGARDTTLRQLVNLVRSVDARSRQLRESNRIAQELLRAVEAIGHGELSTSDGESAPPVARLKSMLLETIESVRDNCSVVSKMAGDLETLGDEIGLENEVIEANTSALQEGLLSGAEQFERLAADFASLKDALDVHAKELANAEERYRPLLTEFYQQSNAVEDTTHTAKRLTEWANSLKHSTRAITQLKLNLSLALTGTSANASSILRRVESLEGDLIKSSQTAIEFEREFLENQRSAQQNAVEKRALAREGLSFWSQSQDRIAVLGKRIDEVGEAADQIYEVVTQNSGVTEQCIRSIGETKHDSQKLAELARGLTRVEKVIAKAVARFR